MTTFGDRLYQFGGSPVGSDLLGLLGKGKVKFVDPIAGSDGASGASPERAFKTLQYAADVSGYEVASQNGDSSGFQDVIVRMPGVEEVTANIDFDGGAKAAGSSIAVVASTCGQRVFGDVLGAHTRMASSAQAATNNLVEVMWRAVSFYGLSFGNQGTGKRTDGTGACIAYRNDSADAKIQTAGGGQFAMVRGCNFRDDGSNDTTGVSIYGGGGILLYQNTFGYYSLARGMDPGITIRGSGTNNPFDIAIRENVFSHNVLGIWFAAATIPGGLVVDGNLFTGNTVAVQFDAAFNQTGRGIFSNNRLDLAEDAAAGWLSDSGANDSATISTNHNMEFVANWYTDDAKQTG